MPPLTPRVLAASSAAAASTVAFATTNGTATSSRAAGEVDCVAMQQLLDRIVELEAQLHEERRALGAEVQRVAEAEARADAAEHHVAHTLAEARVRERAANALAGILAFVLVGKCLTVLCIMLLFLALPLPGCGTLTGTISMTPVVARRAGTACDSSHAATSGAQPCSACWWRN